MELNSDKLLTVKEVVAITGLAKSTLEQWRIQGKGFKWIKLEKAMPTPFETMIRTNASSSV